MIVASIDTEGEWGSIVIGYLASIIIRKAKKSNRKGVGVGGVKREHKSINTSDKDMVDAYEGHVVFDSELRTILLSEKIFVIGILNETDGSCCLCV